MGAIDDLAAALVGQQSQAQIEAANPYREAQAIPDQIGNFVVSSAAKNPNTSLGDIAGTALLSGLFGGAIKNYGDQYSATLNNRLQAAFAADAQGQTPNSDEYLPPSLLTTAKNQASMFKLRSALENAQLDTNATRQKNTQISLETDPSIIAAQVNKQIQIDTAKAAISGGSARGNANNVKITKDLSGTIAAIAALNDNEQKINDLEGGDSTLGGVQRSAESLIPNTKIYNYIKQLPFLADPLTVGLSGTSKMGTLTKTLEALHPGFGQSKESLLDASNSAKQVMIDKAAKYLDVLEKSGYPVNELQDYKEKLDAASSGTLVDNSYAKQATAPSYSIDDLKGAGYSDKDIEALKAQGAVK